MNFLKILIVSCMLTATTGVLAANDMTMLGELNPNETKPVKVYIPVGDLTLTVWSTTNSNEFSCRFLDASGNLGLEQKHTSRCVGNVKSLRHSNLTVVIANEQNKKIDYRITLTAK